MAENDSGRAHVDLFAFFADIIPRFIHETLKNYIVPTAVENNLNKSQLRTLIGIYKRGKATMSCLGHWVNVEKGTMTAIADTLYDRGLIQRQRDSEDRRKVVLTLTEKGEKIAGKCREELSSAFLERFNSLSDADRRELRKAVDSMNSIISKFGEYNNGNE